MSFLGGLRVVVLGDVGFVGLFDLRRVVIDRNDGGWI